MTTTAEEYLANNYSTLPTQHEDLVDALDGYAMLVYEQLTDNKECNHPWDLIEISSNSYSGSRGEDIKCLKCGEIL